jgi:hypothetical protein
MSVLAASTALQGITTTARAQSGGGPAGPLDGHGIERQYPKFGQPDTAYPFLDQFQQGQLSYFGGPVLHTNETYAIFWDPNGAFPAGYEALVERFLGDVAHDSGTDTNVFSVPNQYGDATGPVTYQSTYAGSAVDTDPFPDDCPAASGYSSCFTDAALQAELGSFLSAHDIARPANRVFLVLTPQHVETCFASIFCNDNYFCAYHSGMTTPTGDVLYANLPYDAVSGCAPPGRYPNGNPADAVLTSLSHELKEAITDPLVWKSSDSPTIGWIDPTNGDEADDKCAGYYGPTRYNGVGDYNQVINGHDYLLQSEWSNALGAIDGEGCVLDGADHQPSATFTTKAQDQELAAAVTSTSDPDPGDHVDPRTIHWVFGDGASAFGASVTHHYAAPGTYRMALKVTDTRGGTALFTRSVTVTATSSPAHSLSATTTFNANQVTTSASGSGSSSGMGATLVGGSITGYDFTDWPTSYVELLAGQLVANNDLRQPGKPTTPHPVDSLSWTASLTHTDAASPPAGNQYTITGTFTITGGTGKYYGATGGGTISGTCTSSFTRPDEDCTLRWTGTTSTG